MAFDEGLAERIRAGLRDRDDVVEKKMFGGIAFMVAGRMACGVLHDDLMVRVGPDGHDDALAAPHTRAMDFTGRPMRGMIYVAPTGIATDADLRQWLDRAVSVATTDASQRSTSPGAPRKPSAPAVPSGGHHDPASTRANQTGSNRGATSAS